ncbi:hypothetical protein HK097_000184 [Rhizophlyctis rosea]|uniref:Uncharacterized protein n=1 Tax=Rhizophlyctis rosea TaxID=64517 RepID=A0AAD5X277_9FUNG|nr:hypothetical protein HK097_000184 [Rhizophlyctis rosea]
MGSCCSSPEESKGHRLGGASTSSPPNTTRQPQPTLAHAPSPRKPAPAAKKLANSGDDRDARLAAAEARAQALASKGTSGGKLAQNLEKQKSIGPGRAFGADGPRSPGNDGKPTGDDVSILGAIRESFSEGKFGSVGGGKHFQWTERCAYAGPVGDTFTM